MAQVAPPRTLPRTRFRTTPGQLGQFGQLSLESVHLSEPPSGKDDQTAFRAQRLFERLAEVIEEQENPSAHQMRAAQQ